MQELSRMQRPDTKLSFQDRLYIIQTVNALPPAQFEELCFALDPPRGVIPESAASQGQRSKVLLYWAEGPTGPGLIAIDEVLQRLVPRLNSPSQHVQAAAKPSGLIGRIQSTFRKYTNTSSTLRKIEVRCSPKTFAVSGKMGDLSPEELEAIVQLLRQKTGDDSIELAFFTEGSIKLVLNGSPEGLEKLQELFDSGELAEVLNSRLVEYVHSIEGNTTEARKARLIQALRAHTKERKRARDLAQDLTQNLHKAQARTRDLGKARDKAKQLAQDIDTAKWLARDIDLGQNIDIARTRALVLARAQARALNLIRALAQDLNKALAENLDKVQDLSRNLDIARGIAQNLDIALDIVQNLDKTRPLKINLKEANLQGTNLSNLDLRGVNLKGTDLTHADVTKAPG